MNKTENRDWKAIICAFLDCFRQIWERLLSAYTRSRKETLAELADVILGSLDFTDDHTHESFMDSVVWSDEDFYHVSFIVGRFTSFSPEIEFLSSL